MRLCCFIPQAIKVVKTRDTSAISAKMYGVTVVGFVLWTAYGAIIFAYPVIIANSLCLSSFILAMKVAPRSMQNGAASLIDPACDKEDGCNRIGPGDSKSRRKDSRELSGS